MESKHKKDILLEHLPYIYKYLDKKVHGIGVQKDVRIDTYPFRS